MYCSVVSPRWASPSTRLRSISAILLRTSASGSGVASSRASASSTDERKIWSDSPFIAPAMRSVMSASSSARVSNSLTLLANSSSSSGSFRSLTSFIVTWKTAALPARSSDG